MVFPFQIFSQTNFCFCDCWICCTSGLLVPISCLRTPPSQLGSIGFVPHLDSIPYFWCPPPGLEIATTGPGELMATVPNSRINSGSGERGPLGLTVASLPPIELKTSLTGVHYVFPKRHSQCVWDHQVFPASYPAGGRNLPPGSYQLTAQALSSPEGPAHTAEGPMARSQNQLLPPGQVS